MTGTQCDQCKKFKSIENRASPMNSCSKWIRLYFEGSLGINPDLCSIECLDKWLSEYKQRIS